MKIVLTGVAGSGKSLVGRALARMLDWPMLEGDDFHPPANVERMQRGRALTDADRGPWLDALRQAMDTHEHVVVACSALKKAYRDRLRADDAEVRFVFLRTRPKTLAQRIASRRHFFNPRLLESQLQTLEPPREAEAIILDTDTASAEVLARQIIEAVGVTVRDP